MKNEINAVLENMTTTIPEPEDYTGEDGLQMCIRDRCGSVFKVEYTDCGQRRVYLRLYSGTLRLRDTVCLLYTSRCV